MTLWMKMLPTEMMMLTSEMSVISEVEYAHEGDAENLNTLPLVQQ